MRRFLALAAALAAFVLPACTGALPSRYLGQNGPGSAADCAPGEVPQSPADPAAPRVTAGADGGQKASSQPIQQDPGVRGVNTTWNRGSGPNTNSPTTTESRSQAGAPAVNQGLVIPTAASASANAADNPAVQAISARLSALRDAYATALSRGQTDVAREIALQMDAAEARLIAASVASGGGSVVNNYNFQNSRNSQIVANGSKSGDGPAGAIDAGTAAAVGKAADSAVRSTMNAPAEPLPPPTPATPAGSPDAAPVPPAAMDG